MLSITVSAVNTGQSSTSRRTRDRSNRIRRAAPTTPQEVGDVDLSHTDESVEPESPELAVPMLTAPTDGLPELVTDAASVKAAAASLQDGDGPIAIDAERAGGYRYDNRAYLIQLRRQGAGTVLIDPVDLSADDLSPLAQVLSENEWILHAAGQDLPCLAELGLAPAPTLLFDTEMAARISGCPRVGLAALLEAELNVGLAKEHSAADWSTRPLPTEWLNYAALDVELLVELREVLAARLTELGRIDWATEEFEHIRTYQPTRHREQWRRVSGIHRARSRRQLAIVRELWRQRDDLARTRDISPGRVLPDASITTAATSKLTARADLAALPAFKGRGTRRRIDYWWQGVQRALDLSDDELPDQAEPTPNTPPHPRSWPDRNPQAAARLAAAKQEIGALSEQLGIPVENILTPDTVRRLLWQPPTQVDTATVSERLIEAGARQWQVQLTVDILTTAIQEAQ